MPASRDLVTNGTFKAGLSKWSVYNEQGVDGGIVNGQAEVVSQQRSFRRAHLQHG